RLIFQKSKGAHRGCQALFPDRLAVSRSVAVTPNKRETASRAQPSHLANRFLHPKIALANTLTCLPYLLHLKLLPAHSSVRDNLFGLAPVVPGSFPASNSPTK